MGPDRRSRLAWWSTRALLPVALLGAGAVLLGRAPFDRSSLEPFFDPELGTFPLRRSWFFENLLHLGGKYAVVCGAAVLVVLAIAWWRDARRAAHARRFAYLVACFAATAAVAGAWKELAGQITPWNTLAFGGREAWPGGGAHPTFWEVLGSPGAHAAAGFAWIALYFVGASLGSRHRAAWLAPGLGLGILFALGQHVRGAHPPSHELWSLAIAWTVACSFAALFRRLGWLAWSEEPADAGEERADRSLPWLIGSSVALGGVAFFATDLVTERLEHAFGGVHRSFQFIELGVMTLGLGAAAWLLAERFIALRLRASQHVAEERDRRFQVLGRMAASVAHEVRNPLQTLRLIVDEQRLDLPALAAHPLVPEFEACLERIDRAVDLVYRLARPESSDPDRADLAAAAREAMVALSRITAGRVSFAWDSEPPPAPVSSSNAALRIVIDNLLRNAAEASPEGASVRLQLEPRDGEWRLHIRNRGRLGPRPEGAAGTGGLGLGVPISRQIAGSAGGSIELAEVRGEVVCTLRWPRLEEEAA